MRGFRKDEVAEAFPGPNKDIGYFYYGSAREPPRGSTPRPRYLPSACPLTWGDKPWPKRRLSAEDARVGDVLAGNVELRATCSCGHSRIVPPQALHSRVKPTQMLRQLRFRCDQCGRYGRLGHGVTMHLLDEGKR